MSKQKSRKIKAVEVDIRLPGFLPTPPAIREPEQIIEEKKVKKTSSPLN